MSRRRTTPTAPVQHVRHPGPLAPFRLAGALATSAIVTGRDLADATASGHHLDVALGRSLALAAVTWVALGAINRVLADAATTVGTGDAIDAGGPAGSAQEVEQ